MFAVASLMVLAALTLSGRQWLQQREEPIVEPSVEHAVGNNVEEQDNRPQTRNILTQKSMLPTNEQLVEKSEADVEFELPIRLPPVISIPASEETVRLPIVEAEQPLPRQAIAVVIKKQSEGLRRSPVEVAVEEQDVLLFARGAVRLHPPREWWIGEVPYLRELRLVMAPKPLQQTRRMKMPHDGVWLSYHVQPQDNPAEHQLLELLPSRLRLATENAARPTTQRTFRLGPWPAVRQNFVAERTVAGRSQPQVATRGFHLLAQSPWGMLEFHAESPRGVWQQRQPTFERLLAQLNFRQPKLPPPAVTNRTRDAAAILGSWKAYRSRLSLRGNGEIEIVFDSPRVKALDSKTPSSAPVRLRGRFEARRDLLHVVWSDGSLTNYRWRLDASELLLTDHEGQVSQLKKVL